MKPDDIDPALAAELKASGYIAAARLRSGEVAAIQRMMFTWALCIGCDATGYRTRYCFPDLGSALQAMMTWCGEGDPPGQWIKQKGHADRFNPRRFYDIPIVMEIPNDSRR